MADVPVEGAVAAPATAPTWQSVNTVFSNAKAGMQGVDKDKVKRVIYEMSKDSAHQHEQQRKEVRNHPRVSLRLDALKNFCHVHAGEGQRRCTPTMGPRSPLVSRTHDAERALFARRSRYRPRLSR